MSSSSSNQSSHAPAVASSSRSPQIEDDQSDDGLDIDNNELLADDPLNGDGGLDAGYDKTISISEWEAHQLQDIVQAQAKSRQTLLRISLPVLPFHQQPRRHSSARRPKPQLSPTTRSCRTVHTADAEHRPLLPECTHRCRYPSSRPKRSGYVRLVCGRTRQKSRLRRSHGHRLDL